MSVYKDVTITLLCYDFGSDNGKPAVVNIIKGLKPPILEKKKKKSKPKPETIQKTLPADQLLKKNEFETYVNSSTNTTEILKIH